MSANEIKKIFEELKEIKQAQLTFNKVFEELDKIQSVVNTLCENQKKLSGKVDYLLSENNFLKQQKLANNIVISNVPNEHLNENCEQLVQNLLTLSGLNTSSETFKIEKLVNKEKRGSSLLVKFSEERSAKELIYKSKKQGIFLNQAGAVSSKLENKTDRQLFIKNHLTKINFNLMKTGRAYKNTSKVKYIWFQNNSVLMRKTSTSSIIKIRNSKDITNHFGEIEVNPPTTVPPTTVSTPIEKKRELRDRKKDQPDSASRKNK